MNLEPYTEICIHVTWSNKASHYFLKRMGITGFFLSHTRPPAGDIDTGGKM